MRASVRSRVGSLSERMRPGGSSIRAYFDRLLRYLLVVCRGDEHAARESLQAALVKIVRHVRHFDREEAWWSWLTVVARSCVVDAARRHSRYRALLARYARFFSPTSSFTPPSSTEDRLPDLLEECLGTLPVAERALLAAKYDDGQPTSAPRRVKRLQRESDRIAFGPAAPASKNRTFATPPT